MATSPTILDSDFKYIDKKGNLLRTRTELTIAQMLTFLEEEYQYDHEISLKNGKKVKIDFKTNKGIIEVIDNDEDIKKIRARLNRPLPITINLKGGYLYEKPYIH